jgi:hypothetical protein
MNEPSDLPSGRPEIPDSSPPTKPLALPPELEKLPADLKVSMFSMMLGLVRNTTGPDPDTARIVAESEMHEETCRLEGYKQALEVRDKQNERDHQFRRQRLVYDTVRHFGLAVACMIGIGIGLYLYVGKDDKTLGSNIVVACFVTLLGGKAIFQKDKE